MREMLATYTPGQGNPKTVKILEIHPDANDDLIVVYVDEDGVIDSLKDATKFVVIEMS